MPARNTPSKFWARVNFSHTDEERCWEWTGTREKGMGYGMIRYQGKTWMAHRLAFKLDGNELPEPARQFPVCHTCDNPPCCNPKHLFIGTPQINNDDMIKKGRGRYVRGESQGIAILNEAAVRFIRASGWGNKELAQKYGVHHSTISKVKRHRNWFHVS